MGHLQPASQTPLKCAIEMAFCWRADDAGDPDQYCKETLHFCAFSAGGGGGGGVHAHILITFASLIAKR